MTSPIVRLFLVPDVTGWPFLGDHDLGIHQDVFALHPLVDSVTTASTRLTNYRTRLPDLDNLLH